MERITNREHITEDWAREILDVERHHDHPIYRDTDGALYWGENKEVCEMVDNIGIGQLMALFDKLGLDRNSEVVRKTYRDMGYSLFGYWEVFYLENNNDKVDQYVVFVKNISKCPRCSIALFISVCFIIYEALVYISG